MQSVLCEVEQGKLKGQTKTNIDGKPFLSFLGIPYARPPLGELRFKAPQPPEKWEGVRDATIIKSCCYSVQYLLKPEGIKKNIMGSEDCLYLNVFTPKLFQNEEDELKPVMVYIHGGGFVTGSCTKPTKGPEFLMTEDIVLVTLNYRLGVLGLLTIDDPALEVTGNAGLKDMVQALKWIQSNIKRFCGDLNNVTIFGESAGATAVHYLILSHSAKGLFHKAIMQSGTVLCPWARGINDLKEFAECIGCSETDNKKILEYLQQVPVEKLIECQTKLDTVIINPGHKRKFAPSIEPKISSAFLCEDPVELIESGRYNHVPLMMGYTSLEANLIADKILESGSLDLFVPYYFGIPRRSDLYKQMEKKILQFYFGSDKVDRNKKEEFYMAYADLLIILGVYNAVRAHAKTSQRPIFCYRMSLETDLNVFKKMTKTKVKGASHVDDLCYLFRMSNIELKPGSIEEVSVRRFVKMWTNFARFGNPIPVKDSLLTTEWKPVSGDVINFLNIDTDLVSGTNPDTDRMEFWDKISGEIRMTY